MALRTTFTDQFALEHPIALAPMGEVAGGRLAAAVSNGGGLGMVGGGRGDEVWVDRQLTIVSESTDKPWGIGFLVWSVAKRTVELALAYQPHAVMLSFGDPEPLVDTIHRGGAKLIVQVTNLDEARRAVDVGADLLVAQGSEAGGHCGGRATLPFVPAVVDLVAPTPVLAAGGIADGRGIAAALVLGAAGALIGTRFEATIEALLATGAVELLLSRGGEDTERNRVLDIARDSPWPARYPARTLTNAFLDTWRDRASDLEEDTSARAAFQEDVARGDLAAVPIWAGEGLDLVTDVAPAAELVSTLAVDAEQTLATTSAAATRPSRSRPGRALP
jgi:nitronate monooxygenase